MRIRLNQKINAGIFFLVMTMMISVLFIIDQVSNRAIQRKIQSDMLAAEKVIGVLLKGLSIDPEMLASIESMTDTKIAIYEHNRIITSMENKRMFDALKVEIPVIESDDAGQMMQPTFQNGHYLFWVSPKGGTDFHYVLAKSLDEELAFYHQMRSMLLLISGVILIAALFLGATISRRLTQPIQALVDGAERIAKGDFTTKVKVSSHDEIRDLAETFNRMTEKLRISRQELVTSKDFTDNIIRAMIDMMIVVETDGEIGRVNEAVNKTLGYERGELIGKPLTVVLGPQGLDEEGGLYGLVAKGFVRDVERTYYTKDDRKIPVSFSASVIHGAEDEVQGFVFNAQNLSARKELEARVLQSEKMAAVGQLAGGIAHEINNPIGVILGFADVILRRLKPEDPHAPHLETILREAKRCKQIVEDLLSFARAKKPTLETIDVRKAIEAALILIKTQAKVKKTTIVEDLGSDVVMTQANPTQLQQVMINLCNNAMDAMPVGGTITVTINRETDRIRIDVKDTGTGMPQEIQAKIFDPFFTTKEVGKGTGLGLALVYQIIEKHNGEITVESTPGSGTCFHIYLPISGI